MPLTALAEPGVPDAFGIHFDMEDRGRRVRCHVFRGAILAVEQRPAAGRDVLSAFQRSRPMFERLASNLYDAGHRTPWVDVFGPISRMVAEPD